MTTNNPGTTWRRLVGLALFLLAVAVLAGGSHAHRSRIRTQSPPDLSAASAPVVPPTAVERARIAGGPPMGALGLAHGR